MEDVPALYCDFTDYEDPHYVNVAKLEARCVYASERRQSDRPQEESSSSMYPILNFVNRCVIRVEHTEGEGNSNAPGRKAKTCALIFSGHGFGFQSRTFLKDNDSNTFMSNARLKPTFPKIKSEIINRKVAILGFDRCVMGMLEVGNELKNMAETMIASEGTIPNG